MANWVRLYSFMASSENTLEPPTIFLVCSKSIVASKDKMDSPLSFEFLRIWRVMSLFNSYFLFNSNYLRLARNRKTSMVEIRKPIFQHFLLCHHLMEKERKGVFEENTSFFVSFGENGSGPHSRLLSKKSLALFQGWRGSVSGVALRGRGWSRCGTSASESASGNFTAIRSTRSPRMTGFARFGMP